IQSEMQGQTSTAYIRSEFDLPESLPTFKSLDLSVNYDDGFVAFLNGTEIARVNAPDTLAWDSTATDQHGGIEANLSYANFADGDDKDDFTLRGNSSWNGDRLMLTSATANQTSSAWTTQAVPFGSDYSFTASAVFDIHSPGGTFADRDGLGGEGMTFVLQSNSNNLLGGPAGALGLDNSGASFVAVELDSVATGSFDPDDSSGSHIGIDTSTDGNVARTNLPRFNGNGFFAGQPGPGENLIYLWVDYVGETQQFDAYMATENVKPDTPTVSATVDLSLIFGEDSELFVGFTSTTSDTFNAHEVLGMNIITGVGELGRTAEEFDVSAHANLLLPGKNVLAIQALNVAADDEDLLVVPYLSAEQIELGERGYFLTPSPDEINGPASLAPSGIVTFSHDSAIYVDPFDLELFPPTVDSAIYYTLDGSIPTETSTPYTTPIHIDGAVRVRARAVEAGRSLGPINTVGFSQMGPALTQFENGAEFSSNLPIIVFETFGKDPHRQSGRRLETSVSYFIDPGADGVARLTDTPEYTGRAGLRIRGQSSEGWEKKQYAVEIWAEGADDSKAINSYEAPDKNVSIFGLPADSDWVLNGPYSDKTQLNNFLTFNWYNEIGLYAPRARLVELFVNRNASQLDFAEDYRGTYVLLEKIKLDQNRVDITPMEPGDNAEPEITGGYIWKKDKAGAGDRPFRTNSGQELRMVEPQDPVSRTDIRPGEITPEQKDWLQNHLNEFEAALYGENFADPKVGYAKYIDVDSWVDTWLMVEMTKNIDGFRLSTYYNMDRGGKIKQGPAWDYNLSLGNGNYLKGAYPTGWYKDGLGSIDYPYWQRLFEDPNFSQKVADRWNELRADLFSTENMLADIDAAVNALSNGNPNLSKPAEGEPSNPISRNYDRWTKTSYGEAVYQWPNCFFGVDDCPPSPLPTEMSPNGRPNSYDDYIYIMKWFLTNRLEWMDSQFAPPLSVTPPSGQVDAGTQVTIAGPAGYDVFYTLDGSDPRQTVIISEETELLSGGSNATILVPTNGDLFDQCDDGLRLAAPDACFMNPAYVEGSNGEGAWTNVTLPIGYDTETTYDALIATDVGASMQNVNSSVYIRIPFSVTSAQKSDAATMRLSARYDDGFSAYLWFSGLKTPAGIASDNAGVPGGLPIKTLSYDLSASATHPDEEAVNFVDFDISNSIKYLIPDTTNYLVIQALNDSVDSTDFLADFKLTITTERTEVSPSVQHYEGPITVDRNSIILARGFDAGSNKWTSPQRLTYIVDAPSVAITEINYNPVDPTTAELAAIAGLTADDFEFVEIKNVGSQDANLLGTNFDGFTTTLGS
ncbi:MAG: CotH kinase family protein, partial [Planctomycetales bacterium]|nr:CotH kinase family protein [Planctomycetales bacterium]